MFAALVERAKGWRRQRTLAQVLNDHQQLPVPTTIEELGHWHHFFERWSEDFSFHRYSASRGETILCRTRYNVVTELFDALRVFTNAMEHGRQVSLPEIVFRNSREQNLDYFLTDLDGRPLAIQSVFTALLSNLAELVRVGTAAKFDSERHAADFNYYENKGVQLFADLTAVLSILIYASDLNLD